MPSNVVYAVIGGGADLDCNVVMPLGGGADLTGSSVAARLQHIILFSFPFRKNQQ